MTKMGVQGGMALSSMYQVKIMGSFDFHPEWSTDQEFIELMCDEAQLPNVQAATGTIEGRYLGEGQVNYPHTRVFTELQLGFQCDANMTPLKYLNDWYGTIFGEIPSRTQTTFGNRPAETLRHNRTNKLRRPDTYCKTIRITKTEIGLPYTFSIVRSKSNIGVLQRLW